MPSLPGPADEDDAVVMDVQLGTIHLAQASTQPGASGARGASAPPSVQDRSPQASSNGSVPQPLKRSLGYVLPMILLFCSVFHRPPARVTKCRCRESLSTETNKRRHVDLELDTASSERVPLLWLTITTAGATE